MTSLYKILKGMNTCVFATGLTGSLYLAGPYTSQKISQNNSPKIENQAYIKKILEKERKRAGIKENIKINVFLNNGWEAYSQKIGKEEYKIILPYKDSNLSDLRHELYHIADGHFNGGETKSSIRYALEYLFWHEPQATIYQLTGLKL